jgi:hypothetical protein
MAAKLKWDDTLQNTTRIDFSGGLSMVELFDVWAQEAEMQRSVDAPVYSLNVFSHVMPNIRGVNVRQLGAFIKNNRPGNLQLTVQVTSDFIIFRGLLTLAKTMSHDVVVVQTLDEAHAVILQHQQGATYRSA